MSKEKVLNLESYTSISVSSLKEADGFLENILLSNIELQPRKVNKRIILYGAGKLGKMAKDFFNYLNMPFLYVVDKNAGQYKNDEYWQNTEIIYPGDVKETDKKECLLVVCIAKVPIIELQNELRNNGWKDTAFFYDVSEAYRDQHPIGNGWFLGMLKDEEKESVEKTFSLLTDDISRSFYMQFLAWRKLRVELLFKGLKIDFNNRFFIPEVVYSLSGNEVFVDCGAHRGSVSEKFLKAVKDKYKSIYAIEPDNINFNVLQIRLRDIPNANIIKCALSDKCEEGKFCHGFDFASKLSKSGKDLVRAVTLDSLNIPATFIKMHLEGGELDALKGAVNTIQRYRPIVAVTIYHNPDGVWKIPIFIMSRTNNYKYYIRLHSWGGTGAVFYAVPINN